MARIDMKYQGMHITKYQVRDPLTVTVYQSLCSANCCCIFNRFVVCTNVYKLNFAFKGNKQRKILICWEQTLIGSQLNVLQLGAS